MLLRVILSAAPSLCRHYGRALLSKLDRPFYFRFSVNGLVIWSDKSKTSNDQARNSLRTSKHARNTERSTLVTPRVDHGPAVQQALSRPQDLHRTSPGFEMLRDQCFATVEGKARFVCLYSLWGHLLGMAINSLLPKHCQVALLHVAPIN